MNNRSRINYFLTITLFIIFIVFTFMIKIIDVRPIGPEGSKVGFAAVNQFVLNNLGINFFWYYLTDWLGLVAILFACAFGVLGLCQLIRCRSLKRVDSDILLLGLSYLVIIGSYIIFEKVIISHRPVMIENRLEASYPSSHTMVVVSIMSLAMIQFHHRIKNRPFRWFLDIVCILINVITVIGRLISGVHWFTDIVGGLLLSAVLIMLYYSVNEHLQSIRMRIN